MRKQTKIVAVLSTAALLAVGASMTSFAATGWQEENGTWVYYGNDGNKVEGKWEKSGDNWFYLDDDGEMATDKVVNYSDNYYYVDENGSMASNKWVSVENEDYDGDNDEEPANHWYYFGADGKAYKSSSSSSSASFKTINGKKYIFDEDGKMLYGWVGTDGERKTGDTAWQDGVYYCGNENDGAQSIGWKELDIKDSDYEVDKTGYSSSNLFDDENQTRWFYFKGNGKKMSDEKGKKINGKKYGFDEDGRMNAEWIIYDASPTTATASTATASDGQGGSGYTENWRYYGSPEAGARVTKGWFKVVPDEKLYESKYNDDEDSWYYADKDGKLIASEIKKINSKKYLFDNYGRMKTGLKFVEFDGESKSDVLDIISDDDDNYPFDTKDDFEKNANHWLGANYHLYYFNSDGAMETGKTNLDLDGESTKFSFKKSGSYKGEGENGLNSKKYYLAGMLLKADKDDKYSVVKIDTSNANKTEYTLLDTDEFIREACKPASIPTGKDYSEYYTVSAPTNVTYKLVNTGGTVQKNKNKAKDGSDRCYSLKGETIETIYVEN